MSKKENDHNKNNFDKNKDYGDQDEKRIDQLINLVDKHTRTERHLEQHSDIASPEAIAHSEEIQKEREEEIENLKNVIAHGKHVNVDETANLQRNYEFTNSYISANKDRMDSETLEKTKEKQENRAEQMNNILK
jgi:predicted transcriptional regulator